MSKSMVEKYEQILSADPGSMVFVELAKALLDRGDSSRAIDVCSAGLQHHPESVVGRVLWGKALISMGQPAEAMAQFDEAIAIDRENPYAYNLIGEVLLHKGLHRSALPILKKAVALQPNDTRVRQWLDQVTRALNGEKVSVQPQYTSIDAAPKAESTVPSRPSLPAMGEPTVTDAKAYVPAAEVASAGVAPMVAQAQGEPEVMRGMTDIFQSLAAREDAVRPPPSEGAPSHVIVADQAEPLSPSIVAPPAPPEPPQEAPIPGRSSFGGTIPYGTLPLSGSTPSSALLSEPIITAPGLAESASQQDQTVLHALPEGALAEGDEDTVLSAKPTSTRATESTRDADDVPPPVIAQPAPVNVLARDPAATVAPPEMGLGAHEQLRMARPSSDEAPMPEELLSATLSGPEPRPDHTYPGPPPPAPESRGPDDTVDLPANAAPTPVVPGPAAPPPLNMASRPKMAAAPPAGAPPPMPAHKGPAGKSLLPDLPTSNPGTPSMELPKVELSTQAAEAIAKEYERELRDKLAAAANAPKSFMSRHGLKIGGGVLLIALAGVGLVVFRSATRSHANLPELLSKAHAGLEKDTRSSYQAALQALGDLLEVSPDNAEAHALSSYAHAVLYREHGQDPKDRDAALAELGRPEVEQLYPELAAGARYYLADSDAEAKAAAKPLLGGKGAEAHEIAGKLLLDADPRKAVEQFQESLKAQSAHVRTYVAIGDYYLASGEPSVAENMLGQARQLSDHHTGVLLGLVDARLAQGKELDEAGQDLQLLEKDDKLEAEQRARLDLAAGRLLAMQGQGEAGLKRLQDGLARAPNRAYEFHQAMADADALQGAYDKSLSELLLAEKSKPGADKDLALLDQVARAEIALGRSQDALKATDHIDDRRIHLTRGRAYFEQGGYDAAKRELMLTRRDKTMPTEAAIYLARSELAAGHKEDAKPAIDAIVAAGKLSPKAQIARGELLQASNDPTGAKAAFAAASEDPREYEAPYLLGRALLSEGKLGDARKPLELAVARNHFFGDAHRALGRLLLAEGEPQEARNHLSAYLKEHKDDAVALAGLARANLALGDISDARAFAKQAAEHPGRDAEVFWTKTQVELASGDGSLVLRELEKRAKALRSADAWCDLGDAALDLDDAKAAVAAFAKAEKIEKSLPRARVGTAVATSRLKGKASAKALADLAAPANKLPSLQQARLLAEMARVAPEAAQKDQATAAVAASDASALAHLELGVALGKTPEGQAELSRAVALEPAMAEAHVALAEVEAASGDKAHAVSEAGVALRIVPRGPIADRARAVGGAGLAEPAPHLKIAHGGGKKRKGK